MQGEAVNQYGAQESPYDAVVIGLEMERQALYERINRRVDLMLAAGLEQEVRSLLEQGVAPECQSMQSIGYRQMVWYINGSMDYAAAVDKLKQATRNFAKRQLPGIKKCQYIHWLLWMMSLIISRRGEISEILVESGFGVNISIKRSVGF